ncbi:unnamed protein product, partial [marine sediment metagenome]
MRAARITQYVMAGVAVGLLALGQVGCAETGSVKTGSAVKKKSGLTKVF